MRIEIPGWDNDLHMEEEQLKRLKRAMNEGYKRENRMNGENAIGILQGSHGEQWRTTLRSCTCPDFRRRRLPCKHIYYLAASCGCIDLLSVHDYFEQEKHPASQMSSEEAMAELMRLPMDDLVLFAETLKQEMKHQKTGLSVVVHADKTTPLILSPLMKTEHMTLEELLSFMSEKDLYRVAARCGVERPEQQDREFLEKWIELTPVDLSDELTGYRRMTVSPRISSVRKSLLQVLENMPEYNVVT